MAHRNGFSIAGGVLGVLGLINTFTVDCYDYDLYYGNTAAQSECKTQKWLAIIPGLVFAGIGVAYNNKTKARSENFSKPQTN